MARKRRIEIEQDTVEEVKKDQSPVEDRNISSDSDSDDDAADTVTAPSPNVSDFIIKPIVTESSPMKERGQVGVESKTKKLIETTGIVLGLPKQNVNAKRLVSSKREVKGKVKNEVGSKRLSELLKLELLKAGKGMETDLSALDVGKNVLKEQIGGIWNEKAEEKGENNQKWQQRRLELYIKKLELVQEQTKLVLDELVLENK